VCAIDVCVCVCVCVCGLVTNLPILTCIYSKKRTRKATRATILRGNVLPKCDSNNTACFSYLWHLASWERKTCPGCYYLYTTNVVPVTNKRVTFCECSCVSHRGPKHESFQRERERGIKPVLKLPQMPTHNRRALLRFSPGYTVHHLRWRGREWSAQ